MNRRRYLCVTSLGVIVFVMTFGAAVSYGERLCLSCTTFTCANECWGEYNTTTKKIEWIRCTGGTAPSFKHCSMPTSYLGCKELTPPKTVSCTGCKKYTDLFDCVAETGGTAINYTSSIPCKSGL